MLHIHAETAHALCPTNCYTRITYVFGLGQSGADPEQILRGQLIMAASSLQKKYQVSSLKGAQDFQKGAPDLLQLGEGQLPSVDPLNPPLRLEFQ